MPWCPNLRKTQFLTAPVCYAGRQDPSVPSILYNNSNHKDSERAQGPVRPLIIAINAVLHEENTYPRNKKVILEYVMSSVKFPPHLYNTVAIMKQLPISANTPCNQTLLGISSNQGCSCTAIPPLPSVAQFCRSFLLSPGLNAALTLTTAGGLC